jgi:hypothetical protein
MAAPVRGTGPGGGWRGTETNSGVEANAKLETMLAGQLHRVERCRLKLRPVRGGLGGDGLEVSGRAEGSSVGRLKIEGSDDCWGHGGVE